jgi:tetratricopeptide (TPR) repeat protein
MTEEAEATAGPSEDEARVVWQSTRAKVLARRGQFRAAEQLIAQADGVISPTSWAMNQAAVLMAKAEVSWLAGAPDQAVASLRAALQIYEDRHVVPLAEQVNAALASLTAHPDHESA